MTTPLLSIQDMPAPPSWPLLGHLPQVMLSRGIILGLSRSAPRYGEGLFRIDAPNRQLIVVWKARVAAEVFDVARWDKDIEGPLRLLRTFAGDGLFTADTAEPNWQLAHKVLMPAFTRDAMVRYFPAMKEILANLLAAWDRRASDGTGVDVRDDMTRLTLDTISLTGFGYRFQSFDKPDLHPFLGSMGRVLFETMRQLRRPPFLHRLLVHKNRQQRADIFTMNALVDDVIAARKREGSAGRDLLDLMLTARDDKGQGLSDENIRYQILTFLIAGHETTSNLLSFALRALWRDPPLLARATAEADAVLSDDPTFEEIGRLDLIRRVLFEALRLWPPAPGIGFHPIKDEVLADRYRVPQASRVVVLLPALHRDPEVWPDPERFDPDRFLPENEAKRPPSAYKPFGNGRRACIGRQFALVEAELALASILRRYEVAGYEGDDEVEERLVLKPSRFIMRLKRRSSTVRAGLG